MNISASFDGRELQRAFSEYMNYTKRSGPVVLQKQIVQLAIGAKGVKGLFQEALSTRQATVSAIKALPAALSYRIRRALGFTVKQEIARRVSRAGFYQASGWIVPGIAEARGAGAQVLTQRGSITAKGGVNPSVTIKNKSPQAFEFGSRTGYIQRALNARARDMLAYVEKKMASDGKAFSSNTRPVFTSLAELMRP